MATDWWGLPGPGAFIERVIEGVAAGQPVVIDLPEHHPPGLFYALRREVAQRLQRSPIRLRLDGRTVDPLAFLTDEFVLEPPPPSLRSLHTLLDSADFHGRV